MNNMIKGVILTIIGGICWGISGAAGEAVFLISDVTSFWLVPVRLVLSGLSMLIYCGVKNSENFFDIFKNKWDILDLFIYSMAGIMLCQFTFYYTIEQSNAGTATILQYVAPAMIMTVACIMEKRFPTLTECLCVVLAIGGVFVLATHGNIHHLVISKKALVVGLISAVTVVIYTMQPVRLMKRFSPVYLLAWALFIGGIVLSLVFRPWEHMPSLDIRVVLLVLTTVFVGSVAGFSLYLLGVKLIGPSKASIIASIEPVTAVALSVLILKSPFTLWDFSGFVMIISTIIIISLNDKKSIR